MNESHSWKDWNQLLNIPIGLNELLKCLTVKRSVNDLIIKNPTNVKMALTESVNECRLIKAELNQSLKKKKEKKSPKVNVDTAIGIFNVNLAGATFQRYVDLTRSGRRWKSAMITTSIKSLITNRKICLEMAEMRLAAVANGAAISAQCHRIMATIRPTFVKLREIIG